MQIEIPDRGTVDFYSPEEILAIRSGKARFTAQAGLWSKIINVSRTHPSFYLHHGIGLIDDIFNEVLRLYDFEYGSEHIILNHTIPYAIRQNQVQAERFLSYCISLFRLFGWTVELDFRQNQYYFVFLPGLALSPDAVDAEINRQVDEYAQRAIKVINRNMRVNRFQFFSSELGLVDVPPSLVELVFTKIQSLLGSGWTLTKDEADWRYSVSRNTSF